MHVFRESWPAVLPSGEKFLPEVRDPLLPWEACDQAPCHRQKGRREKAAGSGKNTSRRDPPHAKGRRKGLKGTDPAPPLGRQGAHGRGGRKADRSPPSPARAGRAQAPRLPPRRRQKQPLSPTGLPHSSRRVPPPPAAPPSERQYLGRIADLPAAGTLPGLHGGAGRAVRTTADPEVDATVFAALAPRACVEAEAAEGLGGGVRSRGVSLGPGAAARGLPGRRALRRLPRCGGPTEGPRGRPWGRRRCRWSGGCGRGPRVCSPSAAVCPRWESRVRAVEGPRGSSWGSERSFQSKMFPSCALSCFLLA